MNARLIKVVIILMSVALAGSVFVQVYWSYELIRNNKLDFDNRVNKALYEATFRYKSHVFNQDENVVKYKTNFIKYVDSLKQSSNVEILSTLPIIIQDNSALDGSLKTRYSSIEKSKTNQFVYKGYQSYEKKEGSLFYFIDSAGLQERMLSDLTDLLISTLTKQKAVLDTNVLDSIVDISLKMNGVDIAYEMGIFNTYLNKFIYKSSYETAVLKKSFYETLLYNLGTGDEEQIILRVEFPNSRFYIMQRILFMLGLLIVFTIVIIAAFYITVNMIYNQKQLSEIKNELIANISHELKTPISIISLALQSIEDLEIDTERKFNKNYLKMIEDENKRFSVLVENILLSSLLDSGKVPVHIKEVDAHEVLDHIVGGMQIKADVSNIRIEVIKKADVAMIEADEMMIANLYSSVIENAIKYSSNKPGVEPFVKITTSDLKNKYFKVEIEDNGIGIAKEDQKHIFDKLYRVPSKNIHNVKGHGLGLSYAKSIVKLHDGDIFIKSQLGVGSTFTIILPYNQTK